MASRKKSNSRKAKELLSSGQSLDSVLDALSGIKLSSQPTQQDNASVGRSSIESVIRATDPFTTTGKGQTEEDVVAEDESVRGERLKPLSVFDQFFKQRTRGADGRKVSESDDFRERQDFDPDRDIQEFQERQRSKAAREGRLEQPRKFDIGGEEEEAFDPFSNKFDAAAAQKAGMTRDASGHMGSIGENGLILKGVKHESFHKTVEAEAKLGNRVTFRDGRYYSVGPDGGPPRGQVSKQQKEVDRQLEAMSVHRPSADSSGAFVGEMKANAKAMQELNASEEQVRRYMRRTASDAAILKLIESDIEINDENIEKQTEVILDFLEGENTDA